MNSPKLFLALASLSGFISVALGAFGAHGLKKVLSPDMLAIFETGVKYQMFHALALGIAAILTVQFSAVSPFRISAWFFIFGQIIFSGSLYLLVFTGVKQWGAVTPIGGLALLCGWLFMLIGTLRLKF